MRKLILTMLAGVFVTVMGVTNTFAQGTTTFDFPMSAVLPLADSAKCVLSMMDPVNPDDLTDDQVIGYEVLGDGGAGPYFPTVFNPMSFGDLFLNPEFSPGVSSGTGSFAYFQSSVYFKCRLLPWNGVGVPNVTFQYLDTQNPNDVYGADAAGGNLGDKLLLTVVAIDVDDAYHDVWASSANDDGQIDLAKSDFITAANGGPAVVEFFMGIYTGGGTNITGVEPEIFTFTDAPGDYQGTLETTVTFEP